MFIRVTVNFSGLASSGSLTLVNKIEQTFDYKNFGKQDDVTSLSNLKVATMNFSSNILEQYL